MALVSAGLGTCRSSPSSTGDHCSPFASKPCEPPASQLRSLLLHRSASGKKREKRNRIKTIDEGVVGSSDEWNSRKLNSQKLLDSDPTFEIRRILIGKSGSAHLSLPENWLTACTYTS